MGEEERGQNQYQTLCFVNHLNKLDFISSDSMSKLRQKNPGTIRVAEEDKGHLNYTMDLFLNVSQSKIISKHVALLCTLDALDMTYTRLEDLKEWMKLPGKNLETKKNSFLIFLKLIKKIIKFMLTLESRRGQFYTLANF